MKSRRRCASIRLRSLESLESRAMMSADGLGVAATADDAVQTPTAAAATFASLDDLRQWITEQATAQYGELFGKVLEHPTYHIDYPGAGVVPVGDISLGAVVFRDAVTLMATGDQTNVQVEGVDEADLVETDGDFLYLIAGSELVIIDIRDPENLSVASRVELGEAPTGIYLSGDRLTLVSAGGAPSFIAAPLRWNGDFHTYYPVKPTVSVTVLDVTDREAPTQVVQTEIDGSLVSSRMVDGQLRLVTQQSWSGYLPPPRYSAPQLQVVPAIDVAAGVELQPLAIQRATIDSFIAIDYWRPQAMTYQYESLEEYVDRVLAEWAPTYRTMSVDGEVVSEGLLIDPTQIEKPSNPFDYNGSSQWRVRTTISTFDVLDDAAGPSDTETIRTTGATTVYADGDNLYVFEQMPTVNFNGIWGTGVYIPPATRVTKFSFGDDGAIDKDAQGRFSGTLLNQFAVDEQEGYLRVVTTNDFGSEGHGLSVLQQQGDELVVVGSVAGLAPNETLHSVRFNGDTAYLVTFRNVDPLFVVDLSDPESPTVTGELKIPGYSEYLQSLGENHLLGIGRGANEQSGLFEELQVSIFDVTDGSDPQLAHRYSIEGGRGTTTIATGNTWTAGDGDHHAVAYYADQGVLTLPIAGQSSWGDSDALFEPGEGGLLVLSVDVNAGIEKLALIEHDTPILRSVRVGDTLIVISATQVSSHQLASPADAIDTLDLPAGEEGQTELTQFIAEPQSPQRSARLPFVPAMRGQGVTISSADEASQPNAPGPFVPATQAPVQRSRFTAPLRAATASAAANDEALLLLSAGAISDADESPQDPAVCFEAQEVGTTESTTSGVRQSWRPAVRA
jgi:uncharacterized secreted protein with C-terminal beta-propeller domain